MEVTAISDLHGFYPKLPGGDLLIVAGDLTARDHLAREWIKFESWVRKQNYTKKIIIAGNHDNTLKWNDYDLIYKDWEKFGLTYLCNSGTEFEGFKIWGSPNSLLFDGINPRCTAFCGSEEDLCNEYQKIPVHVDILITHTPAYGILDQNISGHHCGSRALYAQLKYAIRPQVHIFGHIHEAYGIEEKFVTYHDHMMKSINCSHVNYNYIPVNPPIHFEIFKPNKIAMNEQFGIDCDKKVILTSPPTI